MTKSNENSKIKFKKSFFLNLASLKLSPCEFRCLIVLFTGEEYTKAQVSAILKDTPQHVGTAMIHLEKLGIITHTRTEGRNAFFKPNINFSGYTEQDSNQLQSI